MTAGDFFSHILLNIIPFFEIREVMLATKDREVLVVIFENHLTIKKMDLEALRERGVILYGIKKLEFAQDIEQELFMKEARLEIENLHSVAHLLRQKIDKQNENENE